MEWNNEQKKILDKAEFYRANKIVAHVLTIPKGTWKNGLFKSELQENTFYWFLENGAIEVKRLFLSEIFDIVDYTEENENKQEDPK